MWARRVLVLAIVSVALALVYFSPVLFVLFAAQPAWRTVVALHVWLGPVWFTMLFWILPGFVIPLTMVVWSEWHRSRRRKRRRLESAGLKGPRQTA